jgi:hypothetical protein
MHIATTQRQQKTRTPQLAFTRPHRILQVRSAGLRKTNMKKETISHASNKFVFMILKPIPRNHENFRLGQCWQIRIDCPNNLSGSWGMVAL